MKSNCESFSVTLCVLIRFQSDFFTIVADEHVSNVAFTAVELDVDEHLRHVVVDWPLLVSVARSVRCWLDVVLAKARLLLRRRMP